MASNFPVDYLDFLCQIEDVGELRVAKHVEFGHNDFGNPMPSKAEAVPGLRVCGFARPRCYWACSYGPHPVVQPRRLFGAQCVDRLTIRVLLDAAPFNSVDRSKPSKIVGRGMPNRYADSRRREARRQVALNCHLAGLSYRQIALTLGVSHTMVGRDILAVLGDLVGRNRPGAEGLRALKNERYNRPLRAVWPAATRTKTDEHGRTVSDYDDYAMGRALDILAAIRQSNGLDVQPRDPVASTDETRAIRVEFIAPTETDVEGQAVSN